MTPRNTPLRAASPKEEIAFASAPFLVKTSFDFLLLALILIQLRLLNSIQPNPLLSCIVYSPLPSSFSFSFLNAKHHKSGELKSIFDGKTLKDGRRRTDRDLRR